MLKKYAIFIAAIAGVIFSCTEDEKDLPSVEQRVSEAKTGLITALTAPENGWRLDYQPTAESGTFFILLKFNENGTVNIKSDVAEDDGSYFNQTIPYRIDNGLGLELILETYGVFHYLFEQDQASFGAEFEFQYSEKSGDNLVFKSISDIGTPTTLTFKPASPADESLFSRDISENLSAFKGLMPDALGVNVAPSQQLILTDEGLSIFWTLDAAKRTIQMDMLAEGTTLEDIIAKDNFTGIFHNSGYTLLNGNLILKTPFEFNYNGGKITIDEITLNNFDMSGPGFCALVPGTGPKYTGNINGSPATLLRSYFTLTGADFQDGFVYSVNIPFLFDGENNSLYETGSLGEKIPEANGFAFLHNVEFENDSIPSSSTGFFLNDGNIALREFIATQFGNFIQISFTDNIYISGGSTAIDPQSLIEVTDEIFEGGKVYGYNFPQEGVFRLFNTCNSYEIFLVR